MANWNQQSRNNLQIEIAEKVIAIKKDRKYKTG